MSTPAPFGRKFGRRAGPDRWPDLCHHQRSSSQAQGHPQLIAHPGHVWWRRGHGHAGGHRGLGHRGGGHRCGPRLELAAPGGLAGHLVFVWQPGTAIRRSAPGRPHHGAGHAVRSAVCQRVLGDAGCLAVGNPNPGGRRADFAGRLAFGGRVRPQDGLTFLTLA